MRLAPSPAIFRHSTPVRLGAFEYDVPKGLVAAYPAQPRDSARLLVLDREARTVEHRSVRDLPDYFGSGDVLVVNDTRVFPARLRGIKEKTDAKVEAFLLRELNADQRLWDTIVDPARKVRVGNKLIFDEGLEAEVLDNTTSRGRTLRFIFDGTPEEFYAVIDRIGETPIPPYLRRPAEAADKARYQTLFAQERGAVSAPTAGLHFTPSLVSAIESKGVEIAPVTLHKGLGSFRPVEVEDLGKHRMDGEKMRITRTVAEAVNRALTSPTASVTVCDASVARAVESSLSATRTLKHVEGWTDKFIYPPYEFLITERLLCNFHRPRSPLLMLAAAFAGHELLRFAYDEAIRNEYRLFTFGDAMLIV